MYILNVKAKHTQFIDFLKKEATHIRDTTFSFSTYVVASQIIAIYVLFTMKQLYFQKLMKLYDIDEEEKDDFFSYLSVEKNETIFLLIKEELIFFLEHSTIFNLEGFLQFRLKKIDAAFKEMMEEALDYYFSSVSSDNDITWFRSLLTTETSHCVQAQLCVDKNGFHLFADRRLHCEYALDADDDVLAQCVILSPKTLTIHDPHRFLSKEMVVLMIKIFLEKVTFYEEACP